jgi:MFS family permease
LNVAAHHTPSFAAQTLMFSSTALASLGSYYVYDSIGPVAELLARDLQFTDTQIGMLNAIYSLPNVILALVGGVLVDRFGARTVALCTATISLAGAVITALGAHFAVMATGRLIFGIGAETLNVVVCAALAQWFAGRNLALLFALNTCVARLGSYLADVSPSLAGGLYASGWQAPLWLAAGFAALSLASVAVYFVVDRREALRGTLLLASPSERVHWRHLFGFGRDYWLLLCTGVAFYSVIFPFRSTFAIKYLQEADGYTLAHASTLNSYVFLTAAFATPLFGLLADRVGRHATLLVVGSVLLPVSFLVLAAGRGEAGLATALLGVSFSFVPAVLWPAVSRYVSAAKLGTAYGLLTAAEDGGLTVANVVAGYINDTSGASAANPAGYAPMLEFFGALSFAAFLCALALKALERAPSAALGCERR